MSDFHDYITSESYILLSWAWYLNLGGLFIENVIHITPRAKAYLRGISFLRGRIVDLQAEDFKQIFKCKASSYWKISLQYVLSFDFGEEVVSNAPLGFHCTLNARLEGPVNGFGLFPSSGINIELQEYAAQ